jgi:hypothetical protein
MFRVLGMYNFAARFKARSSLCPNLPPDLVRNANIIFLFECKAFWWALEEQQNLKGLERLKDSSR